MTTKPWGQRDRSTSTERERGGSTNEPNPVTEGASTEDLDSIGHQNVNEEVPKWPSPDALTPWKGRSLPPTNAWGADILGADFQARTIPLLPDEEGEVVATAVRYLPSIRTSRGRKVKSRFVLLYLHGRNDYFFNVEAAQKFTELGAAFYALDLRKYGRSLRPWQTIGYTSDLAVYDEEIDLALDMIRAEHHGLPVVILGHSTGGLIATLWSWRNPGQLAGLILNSAWLELQSLSAVRPALRKVVGRLAHIQPRATIIGASKLDTYFRSITEGWQGSGFSAPAYFGSGDDPALTGWHLHPQWKLPFPILPRLPGWQQSWTDTIWSSGMFT